MRQVLLFLLPGLAAAILSQRQVQPAAAEDRTAKTSEEKDIYEAQASYSYPHYYHDDHGYHHHHVSHVNDDAVKGLLVPLAGIALLGAAAIAAANPVLLQIGVVGGSIGKKRRKRAVPNAEDIKILEKFIEQIPMPEVIAQEKRLQASFLQCAGIEDKENRCFERVTCELGKPGRNSTSSEKQVLNIVISDIMRNEHLPKDLKYRIYEAQKLGFHHADCSRYYCKEIDSK